jgi:hypothetical protein
VIRALHRGYFFFLLALIAAPASPQVAVEVSLNQPGYLVGEPIFVNVAFKTREQNPSATQAATVAPILPLLECRLSNLLCCADVL